VSKEEPYLFFNKEYKILILFYINDIFILYYRDYIANALIVVEGIKELYKINKLRAIK